MDDISIKELGPGVILEGTKPDGERYGYSIPTWPPGDGGPGYRGHELEIDVFYGGGVRRGAGDILPGGGADMSEFPERLRKLREKKRLKRYVLSERCGLNSDAIRRYELGTAKPTMDALKSIADEFGVSVDYLMGRTDYPCVVDIAEK